MFVLCAKYKRNFSRAGEKILKEENFFKKEKTAQYKNTAHEPRAAVERDPADCILVAVGDVPKLKAVARIKGSEEPEDY